MKTMFAGFLIFLGLAMVLPMVMFWDAMQIQAGLGNTRMIESLLPLGAGGLGCLALGSILLKLKK